MKEIRIYKRVVLARTPYVKYRFKEEAHYIIACAGKIYRNGHDEALDNPRFKTPYALLLKTRSKKAVEDFAGKLGRSDADKWAKGIIAGIIGGKE